MSDHRPSAAQKRLVAERARGCCEYCRSQLRFATQPFAIEHIDPELDEGGEGLTNLALSCQGCNNHKYIHTTGRDPATGQAVGLFHPRRQKWADHFAWSTDFATVVGLTPAGRATVAKLHLNREGLVNLRQVLHNAGEHPPPEQA